MSDPNAGEWEKSKDSRTSVVGKQPGVNIANMMMAMMMICCFLSHLLLEVSSNWVGWLLEDVEKAANHKGRSVKGF